MNLLLEKIEEKFSKVEFFLLMIAGVTVIFAMFLVTVDVIMRNFFNKPIAGVIEIMNIALIIIVSLGFSYVQGKKENIIIEIFTNRLPRFYRNIFDLLGFLIGLLVMSVITWKCGSNVLTSFTVHEHTMGLIKIPLWPSKALLAIGMAVLSIRLLLDSLLMIFILINDRKVTHTKYREENIVKIKSI
ncbi:TRAP transporter small permease [Robertmurraya korlensis]|uniref:TRAP transporter small permease n=1 Tax=Robertmurraya korlensis TaxID=519977 RepID=UPI000826E541|nr:TRAP transporter small permease [Robertmurraya korlensis]